MKHVNVTLRWTFTLKEEMMHAKSFVIGVNKIFNVLFKNITEVKSDDSTS